MPDLISPVLTSNETAEYLKVNPQVMERYLRDGIVPARKMGRLWRVSKAALDLWLADFMAPILAKSLAWDELFRAGEEIAPKNLTEEKIAKLVIGSRRKSGLSLKSRY